MDSMWKKLSIGAGLATALLSFSGNAEAATYSYNLTAGQGYTLYNVGTAPNQPNTDSVMTIDTKSGVGSVIGAAMNVSFTGDFSSFTGGAAPQGMFNIAISPNSTLSYQGNNYTVDARHQPMLELFGDYVNLWAVWTSPTCSTCKPLGDTLKAISSSSGGTSVPAPGMLGLFGIAAAGIALGRRRKTVAKPKLATA